MNLTDKHFEAINHLGNVLTLFTDKKIPVGTGTTVSYYKADLVSSMDYSPFGAPLKGRTFNGSGSRYGFNGQEKDNEIAGAGNVMTALHWEYDARLGRRWNVDPLASHFPWQSGYAAFNNNPINLIDPDGRAAVNPGETYDETTGKKIHDDGIDDKKIYTGTKTDGSDRKYIGQKDDFKDVTNAFNKQLAKTTSFFEGQDAGFSAAESTIGAGWVGKFARRLSFFREQVTDKGPFDIKQPGKGFSQAEIGNYSFYEGQLFRYDDYGNFNYGAAAKAFGFSQTTALLGAGINQFGKTFSLIESKSPFSGRGDVLNFGTSIRFNWGYIKNNWYPSNFSGFTDDPKDSHMIREGYKQ